LGASLYNKKRLFFFIYYTNKGRIMEEKIISYVGTTMGFALYSGFIFLVAYTIAGPAA